MPVGPSPAGWGAVAVILPATLGAGVGLGWEWLHCQLCAVAALTYPWCSEEELSPCGTTGLILTQRQSLSP